LSLKGYPHRYCDVSDLLEAGNDVFISIEMTLGDLPVVNARVTSFTGMGNDYPFAEFIKVDGEGMAVNTGWA
jgi:hypothetical protein